MTAAEIPFHAAVREWQAHGSEMLTLIEPVLASGRWLQGEAVAGFESALARHAGRDHAVAVGSGTDALCFALLAAGVEPGDEVIVPSFSFIATASAVLRAGAVPRWADVDADGILALDAGLVGPRASALIAVPLYGRPLDAARFESFADDYGLALIEDAAQALGAERDGRRSSSIGLASCFSFDPTKPVAAPGSGGALLTDDQEIAARARRLRAHGRDEDGAYVELGTSSQLPETSAAILTFKLAREREWCDRRREIALDYTGLGGQRERAGERHAFSRYVLRVPPDEREEIREALAAAGVPTQIHYPRPLHEHPVFGHPAADTPTASRLAREVLSLPMHAFLTDDEVARVARMCRALV